MSGILKWLLSRMPASGIDDSSGADADEHDDAEEQDETDKPEGEAGTEGETELIVAIGAEPAPGPNDQADIEAPLEDGTPAPDFVKALRQKAKDDAKAIRKLEEERDAAIAKTLTTEKEPDAIVVGEKPTLEGCDYDADKLATELEAWIKRGQDAKQQDADRKSKQTAAQQAYQGQLDTYKDGAKTLKVKDFDASEKAVEAALPVWQQSAIVKHAKNSALFVYAVGRDAARLKELGAIKDPVEFGKKLATTEAEIKTVQRPKFTPEDKPTGHGSGAPAGKNALEVARANAEKTGNYSEVVKLKKKMREAGQDVK